MPVFKAVFYFLFVLVNLYGLYFFVIGLNFFRREKTYPESKVFHKFAILIPARNEEAVIRQCVESLGKLDYPDEAYEVFVLANNCTDRTVEEAKKTRATVLEYNENIRNKGDVLHRTFIDLHDRDFEAYLLFDADNTVDPNFLAEMNRALDAGFEACQGFREGQNPSATCVSSAHSIYLLLVDLFYNHSRSVLGMNAIITGTGFMVSKALLDESGGWNTSTLTEDIEFTVQNSLSGNHIAYVPKAIFYDEQVITLSQSLVQRSRWAKGVKQVFEKMGRSTIKSIFTDQGKNPFDSLMMMTGTYMGNVSLILPILTLLLVGFVNTTTGIHLHFSLVNLLFMVFPPTLLALFVTIYCKKGLRDYWKGILFFWFFLLTWIPVNLYALFSKSMDWKEIKHGLKA